MTNPLSRRACALAVLLALPATLAAQAPRRADVVARIDSLAESVMKAPVAGLSIAVVKGSDTLVMKGYGSANLELDVPAGARTVHRIGSLTKQFTAAAIMQFVEEGKLRLDDTLGALLPQAQMADRWRGVTLRQLLNHTSGIPSYTDVPHMRPYMDRRLERDTLIAALRDDSLMFAPGTGFYYNNTGYFLLGYVIERLSGRSYAQHVQERVLAPLGLSATRYCAAQPLIAGRAAGYDVAQRTLVNTDWMDVDVAFSAGALCSTVGDLVAWTRALASGRVVSPASYAAMTTPVTFRSPRPMTYGFGLARDTIGRHRVIEHGGSINGFASALLHLPDDSLVVVVLANTSGAPSFRLADNIARAVLGLPLQPPAETLADLPTTPAERARLAGRYRLTQPDGVHRDVTVEEVNGQLVIGLRPGAPPARLQRQRENVYAVAGMPGARVLFDVHDGRVIGFVLDRSVRPLPATRLAGP